MILALAIVVVAGCVAASSGAMLLMRRVAPAGGFFTDSDRAAGVFGVAGTSFAVLLAFVIFLAFSTYDRAKDRASLEGVAVSELFRLAALFPDARSRLQGDLVCYARAVVHDEWPAMRHQRSSPLVDAWLARTDGAVDSISARTVRERVALSSWFAQSADRREGRRGRLEEATPFVPSVLWLALILGGLLIIAYMWFYADPREPSFIQLFMVGAVTAGVVSGVIVIWVLDHPYTHVGGGIEPVSMQASLAQMEPAAALGRVKLPCNGKGLQRAA